MKNLLIPQKIIFEKQRFGNNHDGDYVFAKTPIKNQKIYGFGVDNDISCEIDLQKYFSGTVDLFDGTCEFNSNLPLGFTYNKLNITKENINSILNLTSPIILKMDIEGYEFECLSSIEENVLQNIEQLIVEFHLHNFNIDYFYNIVFNLNKTHKIFHIHGNNCCGLLNEIPAVVELSFINKKLCNLTENDNNLYPDPKLDFKNLNDRDELFFKWW